MLPLGRGRRWRQRGFTPSAAACVADADRRPSTGARQAGAAAVEFAFVFPLLFLLIYGVIVYSYVFVLQESIAYAAQKSAEAAVAVAPDAPGYDGLAREQAKIMAGRVLAWLPASQRERVLGDDNGKVEVTFVAVGDGDAVQVTLRFELTGLFPVLNLPLIGSVPPLPDRPLFAQAVARV